LGVAQVMKSVQKKKEHGGTKHQGGMDIKGRKVGGKLQSNKKTTNGRFGKNSTGDNAEGGKTTKAAAL